MSPLVLDSGTTGIFDRYTLRIPDLFEVAPFGELQRVAVSTTSVSAAPLSPFFGGLPESAPCTERRFYFRRLETTPVEPAAGQTTRGPLSTGFLRRVERPHYIVVQIKQSLTSANHPSVLTRIRARAHHTLWGQFPSRVRCSAHTPASSRECAYPAPSCPG